MNEIPANAAPNTEIEGLLRAAKDAATDDIVARLGESASQAIDLLDRVNRSNVADALPTLAELVRTGDLARIARYARVLGSMEDALTDDMVGRFASLAGEATMMVDRLNTGGVTKLVALLGELEAGGALDRIAAQLPALVDNLGLIEKALGCIAEAAHEVQSAPAPGGGLMPLLAMLRDPENQKALQFFMAVGKRMREKCTK